MRGKLDPPDKLLVRDDVGIIVAAPARPGHHSYGGQPAERRTYESHRGNRDDGGPVLRRTVQDADPGSHIRLNFNTGQDIPWLLTNHTRSLPRGYNQPPAVVLLALNLPQNVSVYSVLLIKSLLSPYTIVTQIRTIREKLGPFTV